MFFVGGGQLTTKQSIIENIIKTWRHNFSKNTITDNIEHYSCSKNYKKTPDSLRLNHLSTLIRLWY